MLNEFLIRAPLGGALNISIFQVSSLLDQYQKRSSGQQEKNPSEVLQT